MPFERAQRWQPNVPETGDMMYLIDDLTDAITRDPTSGQPKGWFLDWSRGALMGGYFNTVYHAKDNRRDGFDPFMDSYYSIVWGWDQKVVVAKLQSHTITAASTTATDGTFTLTVDGEESSGIDHDATAATIRTALLALSTVADNGVVTIDSLSGLGTNDGVCTLTWWDPNGHTVTADMSGLTGNAHVLAVSQAAGNQQGTKGTAQIGYQCINSGMMNGLFGHNNILSSHQSIVAGEEHAVGARAANYQKREITAYRTPTTSPPNGEIDVAGDVTSRFPTGAVIAVRGRNTDDGNAPDTAVCYVASSSHNAGTTTITLGMETPWDINVDSSCYIINISASTELCNAVFGKGNAVYTSFNLVAGEDNTVTGDKDHAFVVGKGNTVSGQYAGAIGWDHTVSGDYAFAAGSSHLVDATYAAAFGTQNYSRATASLALGQRSRADMTGQIAHANGYFTLRGDAQASQFVLRVSTTHSDDTWRDLTLSGEAAAGGTVLVLKTDAVWTFEALIVGSTSGVVKAFSFKIVGAIQNDGGTVTMMASDVTTIDDSEDTDFDVQAVADDTLNALLIQAKDSTSGGDTVRWVATVKTAEVIFA